MTSSCGDIAKRHAEEGPPDPDQQEIKQQDPLHPENEDSPQPELRRSLRVHLPPRDDYKTHMPASRQATP